MKGTAVTALGAGALVLMLAACHASTSSSAPPAATSAPATAAATPSPAPARVPQTVTYVVTGSGPADVTYGPAGTADTGSVPMRVTARLGSPAYYVVQAQLQGGGTVACKIKVDGHVVSAGSAAGGYNIAQCEISRDPLTGAWQSDAG